MKMKQKYELMAIISSTLTDPEIQERLKGLKQRLGEEVVFEEIWGMRDFAYPIKGQRKGYYVVWNFMMTAEEVKAFEEGLKLYPGLVRFLIVKVPENYTPTPLKEIEAGLEALAKEKAEKRAGRKKTKKAAPKKEDKPAEKTEEKPAAVEEKPAAEEKAAEPAKEEAPAEKAEDKKDKSLDEKLDDILSDEDLGL